MNDFLSRKISGENTVGDFLWFAGILLAGFILQRLISRVLTQFVFRILKKYSSSVGFEKLFSLLRKPFAVLIMLIAMYFAFDRLNFPAEWGLGPQEKFGLRMIIMRGFQILLVINITWILLRIVDFFGIVMVHRASLTESKADDQLVPFVKEAIKILVIIFSVFFVLGAVFNLNIASLVAGLGIGGLAVALAAKESLENLLGSFTIFLDKPFVVGDFIQVGNIQGTVEKIGFRSTRIRTLEKSFVTVPNKKMVDQELDNLTLRTSRRAKFFVTVTYSTTPEQLKAIVAGIQHFIDHHPKIDKTESRVKLYDFGASSLNILVLYFINTMEYDTYLNVREEINYEIMDIVKKHQSDFAFPTTTVFLQKES